jgi:hypothetical protein
LICPDCSAKKKEGQKRATRSGCSNTLVHHVYTYRRARAHTHTHTHTCNTHATSNTHATTNECSVLYLSASTRAPNAAMSP